MFSRQWSKGKAVLHYMGDSAPVPRLACSHVSCRDLDCEIPNQVSDPKVLFYRVVYEQFAADQFGVGWRGYVKPAFLCIRRATVGTIRRRGFIV